MIVDGAKEGLNVFHQGMSTFVCAIMHRSESQEIRNVLEVPSDLVQDLHIVEVLADLAHVFVSTLDVVVACSLHAEICHTVEHLLCRRTHSR